MKDHFLVVFLFFGVRIYGIKKEIDLSGLPHKNNKIDWKNSVGYECKFNYGNINGVVTIIGYNKNSMLKVLYGNREHLISTTNFKMGNIGGIIGVFTHEFKYDINQVLQQKNQKIKILDRFYIKKNGRNRKYYKTKCLKCGYENITTEYTLNKGSGCPVCESMIVVEGINDIPTVEPWMVDYFIGGYNEAKKYTSQSVKELYFKCPICGKKSDKKIKICQLFNSHSCGCKCKKYISFPENVLYNLLEQFNIDFIHCATRKVFIWAKNYRYDFYLPNHNCIIETHGMQHYSNHGFSTVGGKTLEEEINNDNNKRKIALLNGFTYFEIDCRKSNVDWIINSLSDSGLLEYLNIDVSKIDRKQLYQNIFSVKRKEFESILYEPPKSKKEIARILKISPYIASCIAESIGYKFLSCKKPVYVYKNNKFLYKFPSEKELERKSEELFGFKISAKNLYQYIDNNKTYRKYYTFKTFNDEMDVMVC